MNDKKSKHPWRKWRDPAEQVPVQPEIINPPDVFITILKSEVTELIDENKALKEKLAKFGHK